MKARMEPITLLKKTKYGTGKDYIECHLASLFISFRASEKTDGIMTQDERWHQQWLTVIDFMKANKRRPSKFIPEERGMRNWWKHQQKLMNAGELKEERIPKFSVLLELGEKYKQVNQYK